MAKGNQLTFGKVKLEADGSSPGLDQMQSPAHSGNIASQETIIEVVHRNVEARPANARRC